MKIEVNLNDLNSVSCDLYDLIRAIPQKLKDKPRDTEDTETTVGDLLGEIRCFIDNLLSQIEGDRSSHWLDE
jgi:hypothetical protein